MPIALNLGLSGTKDVRKMRMANMLGLLAFGVIVAGFVGLFFYLNSQQSVEINAEFARERNWQFEDLLPQTGRTQRRHVLRGRSERGLDWETTILLPQSSSTVSVPGTSTEWQTGQARSAGGLVAIGPPLDKHFETLDLSSPLVKMGLTMMLGHDIAGQIPNLRRVPLEGQEALTVMAVDVEYARALVTPAMLEGYRQWMQAHGGKEMVPICILTNDALRIRVGKALIKAADLDAFVAFCLDVAARIQA